MAGTFKFELVSPERILLSVNAEQVVVPGSEGDFAVLEGHAPLISTLRPGVIHVDLENSKKAIFVKSGFAEVTDDGLAILAEHAFITDEADRDHVEAEIAAVEKALAEEDDDEALRHLNFALEEYKALQAQK